MYRARISVATFVVYHAVAQSANSKEKIREFYRDDDDDDDEAFPRESTIDEFENIVI